MGRIPELLFLICPERPLRQRAERFMGFTSATLLISLVGAAGCTMWGAAPDASLSAVSTRQADPIVPTDDDASDEATLAAIEEFLARTSAYQVAESPAPAPDDAGQGEGRPSFDARDAISRTGSGGFGFDDSRQLSHEVSRRDTNAAPAKEPFRKWPEDEALANTRMSLPSGTTSTPSLQAESRPSQAAPALPTLLSISVRQAASTPPTTTATRSVHAPNVAVDVNDQPATQSIDDWLDEWESQSDNGRDFQAEWRLRLTQLALGRTDAAHEFAPRLSGETRSLLSTLFHTIESVRDLAQNPLLTGDRALSRVNALRHALADRTDPVIAHVALCRRVVTFGVYEEMEPTEFVSGRSIQTIVYSEIDNFSSRRQGDAESRLQGESALSPQGESQHALYETRLATRIDVFTVDGTSMWSKQEPEIVDRCRRRRTDFFLAQLVTLPPTLPAGEYVMKVYVEDKLSGKAAEATHPFSILSPVSVAQRR